LGIMGLIAQVLAKDKRAQALKGVRRRLYTENQTHLGDIGDEANHVHVAGRQPADRRATIG